MVIYATDNGEYNEHYELIMTWHIADNEPIDAVPNFTYNLNDKRILRLGKGKKKYFATSCGYLTKNIIFALVEADCLKDCMNFLKEQYPLLKTDGSGARYIGIHIREIGVPELLTKTYDKLFYKL